MAKAPQVFLSYAREDRTKAEQIYDALSAEGFNPWMDIHDIQPGQPWKNAIKRSLNNSDFVLVLLSKNSISKRGYIQVEIKAALSIVSRLLDEDIFLIPVRLDDCPFPETLAQIQSVDLSSLE